MNWQGHMRRLTKFHRVLSAMIATGCIVAAGYWWWTARQQALLDRTFQDAVAELIEHRIPADLFQTIERLESQADRASEARLLQGAVMLRDGHVETAAQLLSGVRPRGNLRVPTLLWRGEALYLRQQLPEAEALFRTVAIEHPDLSEPHRWLATIYYGLGAMHASLVELKQVARLLPNDYFAFRLMGLVYNEDFGQYEEAILNYYDALARDPPEPHLSACRRELAQCLILQNRYREALQVLEQSPDRALELALRAECYWALDDTSQCQRLLARAYELDPEEKSGTLLRARLALEAKDPAAAVPLLEKLLAADPHDTTVRQQLSLARSLQGDRQEAEAQVALMQHSRKLRDQLTDLYDVAMREPENADVRERIAETCDQLGKPELAARWRRIAEYVRRTPPPITNR